MSSMEKHLQLWESCINVIKDNINDDSFKTWFEPIVPVGLENRVLILQVPSPFFVEMLEAKYIDIIRKTITRFFGQGIKLEYRALVDKTNNKEAQYTSKGVNEHTQHNVQQKQVVSPYAQVQLPPIDPQLNNVQTFGALIEGNSNKLARTAGLSIAKTPGNSAFNPCFIYGKSGVGKSHLANAIGLEILKNHPNKRVLYVPAHTFVTQYTDSVRNNTKNDFLNFYQTIDVLILDDVHELSGKVATQNVYFHIFNHLHKLGKQLILTCDRPPSELENMEERLLSRFKWRLVADMQQPDFEMRKQILHSIVKSNGLDISEEVINFIANNVKDTIRDLEGVLSTMIFRATLQDSELTIELAESVIDKVASYTPRQLTVDSIKAEVCEYFELSVEEISTKSRKWEVVKARQIAMYLAKTLTSSSLTAIGKSIGNRNHATVHHSCQKVEDMMETDRNYRKTVEELKEKLKN